MTTAIFNEPLPQTADQVAAVVHAHDCGCPPDHPGHAEHLHQNQVWVTKVLGCAYRIGYRLVTDPHWTDPETAVRDQHHCTDECGYTVRHDLAGHPWYEVDPPSDEHDAAVAALAQAMHDTDGTPAEVARWLAEHDWRVTPDGVPA